MTYTDILYEKKEPLARITLHRPTKLNALSKNLISEMVAVLDDAEADEAVRVVILSGAGRAFSAGYDMSEEAAADLDTAYKWRELLDEDIRATMKIWHLSKPVIAQVHGYCLAGACELAMVCDITVASEDATFGEPEIRYGSGPVTLIMPYAIGLKKTKELLYTGDTIGAQEALRLGMVNRVVPRERLEAETEELALRIARAPHEVVRLTKAPINKVYELMGLLAAVDYNLEASSLLNSAETPEQQEFDRIAREQGLKAALNWRDSRYGTKL
jgi:enoyl-CoA hydratase